VPEIDFFRRDELLPLNGSRGNVEKYISISPGS
jgi:hypothetical protein